MSGGKRHPRLTVIVPSYQQGRFLGATLAAIRAATDEPVAIHVLDAGSTDETVDVLREQAPDPYFTWRSRPDAGVHDAVAEGLRGARTEFCAVQSSDDLYLPGALDEAMRVLDDYPGIAAVYGDAKFIDADGALLGRTTMLPFSLRNLLTRRSFVMQSSAVFRTSLAREVGGFRPERPYVCDSEMWLRMALDHPLLYVPRLWSAYRIHGQQRDRQADRIAREWWELVRSLRPAMAARERRWARIGAYMTEHRYGNPHGLRRALALWQVIALDPTLMSSEGFPRRDLALPLLWLGSRLKDLLRSGRSPHDSPAASGVGKVP